MEHFCGFWTTICRKNLHHLRKHGALWNRLVEKVLRKFCPQNSEIYHYRQEPSKQPGMKNIRLGNRCWYFRKKCPWQTSAQKSGASCLRYAQLSKVLHSDVNRALISIEVDQSSDLKVFFLLTRQHLDRKLNLCSEQTITWQLNQKRVRISGPLPLVLFIARIERALKTMVVLPIGFSRNSSLGKEILCCWHFQTTPLQHWAAYIDQMATFIRTFS